MNSAAGQPPPEYATRLTARVPWLMPAATAAAGIGSLLYVRGFDKRAHNLIPPCLLHSATGLWCPGCGLTRGTNALLHGHVPQALGFNVFTPLVLAAFVYTWLTWASPRVGGPRLASMGQLLPRATWKVLGALVIAFTIARNLPIAPLAALAP